MGYLMPFWEKKSSFKYIESKISGKLLFKELEVSKNILNPTDRGYNKEKTYTLNVCRRSFI